MTVILSTLYTIIIANVKRVKYTWLADVQKVTPLFCEHILFHFHLIHNGEKDILKLKLKLHFITIITSQWQ